MRADDRAAGHRAVKEFLDSVPESPDRQAAWRWASDYFGTMVLRAAVPAARAAAASPRVALAGDRLERSALAGVVAHPSLRPVLAELPEAHFHDATHRALRAHLVDGATLDAESVALLAELDARAEAEGIDEETAKELLLRLRERELRAELQHADFARTKELQQALRRIQEAYAGLGEHSSVPD